MKADKNTTANEPVWNLDTLPEHTQPDQPEQAEYWQISYRGKVIKPKPYERILLQAYNHKEINWQSVDELRAKAKATLSADEWLLYRKADKAFKVWHRIDEYICDQFYYLNTYTNLMRKVTAAAEKQNGSYSSIIDKETMEDFKGIISKIFAFHTMEQRLFVSNNVAPYLNPPRLMHHLMFIIASFIEYCKIAEIDFKPNWPSFNEIIDIIGYDKYAYNEIKKTVLFYSERIEL